MDMLMLATCESSLFVELTLLLSELSSSSWPPSRPFAPFLSLFDWHCTSVNRPEGKTNTIS